MFLRVVIKETNSTVRQLDRKSTKVSADSLVEFLRTNSQMSIQPVGSSLNVKGPSCTCTRGSHPLSDASGRGDEGGEKGRRGSERARRLERVTVGGR